MAKSTNVPGSGTGDRDDGAMGPPGKALMTTVPPAPIVSVFATTELAVNSAPAPTETVAVGVLMFNISRMPVDTVVLPV